MKEPLGVVSKPTSVAAKKPGHNSGVKGSPCPCDTGKILLPRKLSRPLGESFKSYCSPNFLRLKLKLLMLLIPSQGSLTYNIKKIIKNERRRHTEEYPTTES